MSKPNNEFPFYRQHFAAYDVIICICISICSTNKMICLCICIQIVERKWAWFLLVIMDVTKSKYVTWESTDNAMETNINSTQSWSLLFMRGHPISCDFRNKPRSLLNDNRERSAVSLLPALH